MLNKKIVTYFLPRGKFSFQPNPVDPVPVLPTEERKGRGVEYITALVPATGAMVPQAGSLTTQLRLNYSCNVAK